MICDSLNLCLRGWLHERFREQFHVQFAANCRCDLLYLQFGVAHGIATVYTLQAIWCCDMVLRFAVRFAVQFGARFLVVSSCLGSGRTLFILMQDQRLTRKCHLYRFYKFSSFFIEIPARHSCKTDTDTESHTKSQIH
jgi:hypothetical protein